MHRIYEWIRIIFKEKINAFIKGFTGGSILSYIFLYGSSFDSKYDIIIVTVVKLIAIGVGGLVSGIANLVCTDVYAWAKTKWIKKKKTKTKRNETKAKIKRAS